MAEPIEKGSTEALDQMLAQASSLLASDPEAAAGRAREIIGTFGSHPVAMLILGASHTARNDPHAALDILEPLSRSEPDWAAVHFELGIAQARIGRVQDAADSIRRAADLKPDTPHVWLALADQLARLGDAAGADDAYTEHVRHSARDPELMRAAAALRDNRLPDAERVLVDRLRMLPTDVVAMHMMSVLVGKAGKEREALGLITRCLELAPGYRGARQFYAQMLNRNELHTEALAEAEALLATEPMHPGIRNLKALILCRIGDYPGAIEILDRLVEEFPDQTEILLNHGNALKAAGAHDRAIGSYRRIISLDPASGDPYWSLANLKTYRFDAAELSAMRGQLQRTDLTDESRLHLEFALAKALEDLGDYAESFQHYSLGNELRLAMTPYSAAGNTAELKQAKRCFNAEFFDKRPDAGCAEQGPIFIVGLPRSGSTLIAQILSSHSQVEGASELPDLPMLVDTLQIRFWQQGLDYQEGLGRLDLREFAGIGKAYLDRTRIHRRTDSPYFTDKMPNNFVHVGLIHLILPNARIIDARRHPLACCLSGFKQHFARGQNFTYRLEDIGRYYKDYVEFMDHFDQVLPGRVHRVFYEQMVEDTEAQVRRLLDYCGLPFEEQCLRFFENPRAVATASSEQVRRPIYRDGVDHWRHFEPWLGPLKEALGSVLDAYPAVPAFASAG